MVSDSELIKRFLSGDRGAFDELVLRHQKQVYATAYRMVGNADTAEEIAQETFIRAFSKLPAFRRKAKFTTWLYRITMNLCYSELKRRQKETKLHVETHESRIDNLAHEKMESEERKMWLERQIDVLPLKQKSVVVLRIFREMSFKEIARTIGCTTNSAKVSYHYAILKLKDALANSGEQL